ncbi:hypothetical protein PoB_004684300 [Plakobranchus ocellatus]|uniref:Secreted protein n=1 Tax=Plakobranchus ocellatus TaxID=259542 RepID=A0AAV4BNG9_9GAST|nr:hypothetical protein PoB_004684300 [Plakobranchus ocellatus]
MIGWHPFFLNLLRELIISLNPSTGCWQAFRHACCSREKFGAWHVRHRGFKFYLCYVDCSVRVTRPLQGDLRLLGTHRPLRNGDGTRGRTAPA